MTIKPVQFNTFKYTPSFKQNKDYKSYLEETNPVYTDGLVKPLPPKGHLVDDDIISGTKYFFKDICYDIKSFHNGIKGTANDHQLGRLNDVGLRLGGIGIAVYLASRTNNPKLRMMEYLGLGTFLAAMAIYPKIAINAPAKFIHGYDIDKEYIDDQGRKKSVQQDSNYVPYDMYLGARKDEDIDAIGDKMGIPRNIKNRHDLIKEQMRKIAIQNNTLWMLTAGLATPVITALTCCGLENYVVSPAIAKSKNKKANKQINEIFNKLKYTFDSQNTPEIKKSNIGKKVADRLTKHKNNFTNENFNEIVEIITRELPNDTAESIKSSLKTILSPADKIPVKDMVSLADNLIPEQEKEIKSALKLTEDELSTIINRISGNSASSQIEFETELRKLLSQKAINAKLNNDDLEYASEIIKDISKQLLKPFKSNCSKTISDADIQKVVNLTNILQEFKENIKIIDKYEKFKFEYAPETIIARSTAKFENTLFKELGIKYKDLVDMRDSAVYTQELLKNRISRIAKDEVSFKKVVNALINIAIKTDSELNGTDESDLIIKKLINSYEYLYNGTAKRLEDLGGFDETVRILVGEPKATSDLIINSENDLFSFLDGTAKDKVIDLYNKLNQQRSEYWRIKNNNSNNPYLHQLENEIRDTEAEIVRLRSKGLGSDKFNSIERIFARYQNCMNGYNKIIHTFDVYRKLLSNKEISEILCSKNPDYTKQVIKMCKKVMLTSNSSDHFNKLNMVNAPEYYQDIMKLLYEVNPDEKTKGVLSDILSKNDTVTNNAGKKYLERLKGYVARFRNLIANDQTDFQKPFHRFDDMDSFYEWRVRTPKANSDLIGQSIVDQMRKAAGRKYGTQKWVRIMSSILGGVLGTTLLTQFAFGKIRNPHNIQRKVNNGKN